MTTGRASGHNCSSASKTITLHDRGNWQAISLTEAWWEEDRVWTCLVLTYESARGYAYLFNYSDMNNIRTTKTTILEPVFRKKYYTIKVLGWCTISVNKLLFYVLIWLDILHSRLCAKHAILNNLLPCFCEVGKPEILKSAVPAVTKHTAFLYELLHCHYLIWFVI